MNRWRTLCVQTSTLPPPSMHQKPTQHGRYWCMQNNQLPTQKTFCVQRITLMTSTNFFCKWTWHDIHNSTNQKPNLDQEEVHAILVHHTRAFFGVNFPSQVHLKQKRVTVDLHKALRCCKKTNNKNVHICPQWRNLVPEFMMLVYRNGLPCNLSLYLHRKHIFELHPSL